MKAETYEAIREYMDANAKDMRLYGSLVGRSYLGEGGRATLGDVDALLQASKAQFHADNMWKIYLEKEFGTDAYEITSTEKTYLTKSGDKMSDVLRTATSKSTGEVLSKLQSGSSQITGRRLMGITPTGEHALDLHPITDLKYSVDIAGTKVKTIPVEDLIWGKQTIGNPPIGTITIGKTGSEVTIEMGGRVKDAFDTMVFAQTAAADAYRNPKINLDLGMRLESDAGVLSRKVMALDSSEKIGGYPEGVTLGTFLKETVNPLERSDVQLAKFHKLSDAAFGGNNFFSGIPMADSYYFEDMYKEYGWDSGGFLPVLNIGYYQNNEYKPVDYSALGYKPSGYDFGYNPVGYKPVGYAPSNGTSLYRGGYEPETYMVGGYNPTEYTPVYTPNIIRSYNPSITFYQPRPTSNYNPATMYQPQNYSPNTPPIPQQTTPRNLETYIGSVMGTVQIKKPLVIETPKDEKVYHRKRRIPRIYLFEEIAPALTPKEMLGEKQQQAFYRLLGHENLVEKRTPPSPEIYRRADADFTNRATDNAQGMTGVTFFRTATKKEGAPRIMKREATKFDVVELVGGTRRGKTKPSRADRFVRSLF